MKKYISGLILTLCLIVSADNASAFFAMGGGSSVEVGTTGQVLKTSGTSSLVWGEGETLSSWYLPSLAEMILMYDQNAIIGCSGYYWTSVEVTDSYATYKNMDAPGSGGQQKQFTSNVRAIRAFDVTYATGKYAIGDTLGGGKVFYVDSTGKKGLIASLANQTAATWWNGTNISTGAVDSAVYAGKNNTIKVIDIQGTGTYAAITCRDYIPSISGGGVTDATYIVQTSNGSLTAEQALGSLSTGIIKNTTATGVLSIAVAGTDFAAPNQDTTGKSAKTDALNSATTIVDVSSATAPTIGQILTAVDSTHATWQTAASGGGAVSSVFGRTGTVTAATNDYTWAQVDKTTSSLADITTKSHTALSDVGNNNHATIDTFIASKGGVSGLASLNASSLVVQDPANATVTPTANKIPKADGAGKLDGWITPTAPGGADTQVQFKNGNAFAGDGQFAFNPTTKQLSVGVVGCAGDITAEGGNFVVADGYKIHTFLASGTFVVTAGTGNIEYLLVGGGGGGGNIGGGGGGGGLRESLSYNITPGSYSVIVGTGGDGTAAYNVAGANGGDTSFNGIIATGGGGGGSYGNPTGVNGNNGGSGGGGGCSESSGIPAGGDGNTPATVPLQGYNGGAGFIRGEFDYAAGGGGGATQVGGVATSGVGGKGGDGKISSISGTNRAYAGGGGGGAENTGGVAGQGGGGTGGCYLPTPIAPTLGEANTGGGGGGSRGGGGGAKGGSGIVIIRYAVGAGSGLLALNSSNSTGAALTINQQGAGNALNANGNIALTAAGNKLLIKTGTNASAGVATLSAGAVVVSNTLVTANSMIFTGRQEGGVNTGVLRANNKIAGVSFTISSSNTGDTGVVAWWLIELIL